MIQVRRTAGGDSMRFEVTVGCDASTTRHEVTMSTRDYGRLGQGRAPEQVIEAAFRFLLDREASESILSLFDVKVIGTYFPEFERELPRYLS